VICGFDLDRIRKQFPSSQFVKRFKLSSGRFCGLIALSIEDVNFPLQTLGLVSVRAELIFEKADPVA
jgi:hypothetical protein